MKLPRAQAIKMSSLSRREIILAALFLLISLATLYYRFILEPQWKNIKKLQTEIKQQQKILNHRLSEGWDNIPSLKARSKKLNDRIDEINLTVSNIKNDPALLVDFYSLAKLNNIHAKTIKFDELKEVKDKFYSTFNISLDVIGYNLDIYHFIEALEKYPRLNRIAEIELKPLNSRVSSCKLVAEFYVLHKLQPDPHTYPFMDGAYGKGAPYNIFGVYNQEQAEFFEEPADYLVDPFKLVIPGIVPPEPIPSTATKKNNSESFHLFRMPGWFPWFPFIPFTSGNG